MVIVFDFEVEAGNTPLLQSLHLKVNLFPYPTKRMYFLMPLNTQARVEHSNAIHHHETN